MFLPKSSKVILLIADVVKMVFPKSLINFGKISTLVENSLRKLHEFDILFNNLPLITVNALEPLLVPPLYIN